MIIREMVRRDYIVPSISVQGYTSAQPSPPSSHKSLYIPLSLVNKRMHMLIKAPRLRGRDDVGIRSL